MDTSLLVRRSPTPSATRLSGTVHDAVSKNPHEVADIVANLAWTPREDNELAEYFRSCVTVANRVITGADHAGITVRTSTGAPVIVAHTDRRTQVLDQCQYDAGAGPCLPAMGSGAVVRGEVASSGEQWPVFTAAAIDAGVRSFLAVPLGTGVSTAGALTLYSDSADGFGPEEDPLLLLLAGHATRALQDYLRLRAAEIKVGQLEEAMASRAPIEQAKGILMAVHHCDADAAFILLRVQSQNTNTKLNTVAQAFVNAHTGRS